MIETIQLQRGVTLQCHADRRFKQGCLSFQLIRPMRSSEAALNALLPTILLRGSVRHRDLRAITMRLDELYGAAVGTLVRRIGDYQTTGLYCTFMDDRFCLPGDYVFAPMTDFLRELLLEPLTDGCSFDTNFVGSEKKNLIALIESERNDKRAYAMGRMLRAMCRADSYGVPRLGEKADVARIDARALYAHYERVLRESPVHIFYVGSTPAERVAELLRPLIEPLAHDVQALTPQTAFSDAGGAELSERMDVTQGKLCLGYVTPVTCRDAGFAATQVMNTLFGAGMTSRLFQIVREKRGLCYAIDSAYYNSKGIITVSAGMDLDKEQRTRDEISCQLEAIRLGQFSDTELNAAKEELISALRGTHDSPGNIESYYASGTLSGMHMTPEAYIHAVETVTAAQTAAAAQLVQPHTAFSLRGVE